VIISLSFCFVVLVLQRIVLDNDCGDGNNKSLSKGEEEQGQ